MSRKNRLSVIRRKKCLRYTLICGRFIVAYKIARRQDYSLVKNTVEEAMILEKPKTLDEALALTEEFLHYYNYERIKGNGPTPYEEREMAFQRLSQGE
jgi:hypothetical protein